MNDIGAYSSRYDYFTVYDVFMFKKINENINPYLFCLFEDIINTKFFQRKIEEQKYKMIGII